MYNTRRLSLLTLALLVTLLISGALFVVVGESAPPTPEQALADAFARARQALAAGMSPTEVADRTFEAIAENRFYILTHPELSPLIEARMAAITKGHNPVDLRTVRLGRQAASAPHTRQSEENA